MHGKTDLTVKQAFELSSNVGMAKLVTMSYSNNPNQYLGHLKKFRMDTLTGIDLTGERKPVIIRPGSRLWGPTTLPWMAFGYNIQVTPLQTLSLYNSVANNGIMMLPYLVNAVKEEGAIIHEFQPTVVDEKICSLETLKQVRDCLEGVCTEGTARKLFLNSPYKVAGKTGTALVANGSRGYADQIFQSSFVGFFPAENPQYTILVVIVNKPHVVNHFGASVAGPVFKEIADRLYVTYVKQSSNSTVRNLGKDSNYFKSVGYKNDASKIMKELQMPYSDSTKVTDEWININGGGNTIAFLNCKTNGNSMPLLKGMGLKDAIYICETMGLKVSVNGKGKVVDQSINAGQPIARGQIINVALN
jgi:cell division protein FtsI (penicillin-binding protein 3)